MLNVGLVCLILLGFVLKGPNDDLALFQHILHAYYRLESRYSSCRTRMLTFSVIIGPNLKLTVLPAPFISIFVKIFQNIFYSLFG